MAPLVEAGWKLEEPCPGGGLQVGLAGPDGGAPAAGSCAGELFDQLPEVWLSVLAPGCDKVDRFLLRYDLKDY